VKWLLDTDTVIYYMNERAPVVERLEATRPADRFLSPGGKKFAALPPILLKGEALAVHTCRG
jgi:hypothetical protein